DKSGHSYWRLVLMPEGTLSEDGKTIYDQYGTLAKPLEYKLSPLTSEPSLLEAFIQLVNRQADYDTGMPIDWLRIEDTLQWAMAMHRDQWPSIEAMGYQLMPGKDERSQDELKDRAAQIVRLNALVAAIDGELAGNEWAWSRGGGNIPPRIAQDPNARDRIQKSVDMWTAIRGAASEEIINLNKRLSQIGVRTGTMPVERLVASSSRSADEQEAQAPDGEFPPGTWFCSNDGMANSPDNMFCASCGRRRPPDARVVPALPVADELAQEAGTKCVNGHEMMPGWAICPICGEGPMPA
ncbi:MAG: zinc ribbon domain-containing protein, partial [Bryobacterales bacterium]|nr:zinc ribbon domain-containing protein [Bryobacterales bacterium]